MTIIKETTSVEYELESKSLQLLKKDCLRLNDNKLSPIRNLSSLGKNLKKLPLYVKSISKEKFLKKYRRIVEIMRVSIQNSTIKTLMHFLDLEYHCFTFRDIDMCPALEEYSLLTEFPRDLYKVYFHQRRDNVITDLVKLIKIPDLYKMS